MSAHVVRSALAAAVLLATAACTSAPQPPKATAAPRPPEVTATPQPPATSAAPEPVDGPVTGTLTYTPGYSWGPQATLELRLDGETATLTYSAADLPPESEQRAQDRDEQMLRALRHRDALDGVDAPEDPDCMDGDGGSMDLTVGDQEFSESFGCSEPGVTKEAITAAGFDVQGILDDLRESVAG